MSELKCYIMEHYGSVNLQDYFYDADIVRDFAFNHRWKNKNLLLIHLSAILNALYNMQSDLRQQQISINLKSRYDFQELLPAKSSKKKTTIFISSSTVLNLINQHNSVSKFHENGNHLFCLSLLQIGLGIRFNNLDHLTSGGHSFLKGSCAKCCNKLGGLCDSVSNNCMDKITFDTSKTGNAISTYLIPQLNDCYRHVSSGKFESLKYQDYSAFLKKVIGPSTTTHHLRKFLCNLCVSHRNTGTWAVEATMKNHYLASHVQFFEFYQMLLREGIEIGHTC